VFVIGKDARVSQRRVVVGATVGEAIELRSGLQAGERVAVKGAGFLGDGDLVRVAGSG
jgi:hypothetical protein